MSAASDCSSGVPTAAPVNFLPLSAFAFFLVPPMNPVLNRLGTTVVIAGYSSGGVRFFHAGNGTELGSAETGTSVLAVKRSGQVMPSGGICAMAVLGAHARAGGGEGSYRMLEWRAEKSGWLFVPTAPSLCF